MFQIAIVSAKAPKANGGAYRRPVHIRVYDPEIQPTAYARAGKGRSIRAEAEWRNMDSRYTGLRSAHGCALREAKELVDRLNLILQQRS